MKNWFISKSDSKFDGRNLYFPTPFLFLGIIILSVLLWSTWYKNNQDENSVVLRLGEYKETTPPGMHLKFPWPIDTATSVKVSTVHQDLIGYRIDDENKEVDVPGESTMLTGDKNLVLVDWALQYQTGDARAWLYASSNPSELLHLLSRASMRGEVGKMEFEDIVTTGRSIMQSGAVDNLRKHVQDVGLNVSIVGAQVQDTNPPKAAQSAFKNVSDAMQSKQRKVEQANGHRNKVIPEAEGIAAKMIADAEGYRATRIGRAKGETERYVAVLKKYREEPRLTRDRIRFETLEAILPKTEQVIDVSGAVFKHLPLATTPIVTK